MKSNINIVLPIALSLILPWLSLYSYPEVPAPKNPGLFLSWLIASTFLYLLWQFLWSLWDLKTQYKNWRFYLVTVGLMGVLFVIYIKLLAGKPNFFVGQHLTRMLLGSTLFLAVQYALKSQQNISRLSLEKEQMQTENYKTQLKALRTQIDPHFLFNSLNTLRSMVRQQHKNSEKFIISLSDFYRQTLKHNDNTTLPLSEELTVLQSYLFLMKNRNEEAVSVNIDIHKTLHHLHLPTLALQVIIENCFKHNSMTSKKPLHIKINDANDNYIRITNNLQPKFGQNDSSGYGLSLLRKRYELLNIEHGVVVQETPDQYSVKLKLLTK